jgi:crotonobetainyl-CoA:carnitine CoA-transferase CaiB-like acyl-CoA transferase
MDHTGAYFMAMAIMMALHHRNVTGEGQWVDLSCTEAACTLNGPALLDATVNGRPLRRPRMPDANRSQFPPMAPHNIYRAEGDDNWIAIACRSDEEWVTMREFIGDRWATDPRFDRISGRIEWQDELDANMTAYASTRDRFTLAESIRALGIPATAIQRPEERVDKDPNTEAWGLWPTVTHTLMGEVRVDGLPVHLSETDWRLERGAGCLGEHNEQVYGEILGMPASEIADLRTDGVI